jgi:quercetin dioxygenase-like cupin family protein
LSQVENNRANPSLNSLSSIADALGCSTIDIIEASDAGRVVAVTTAPTPFDSIDRPLLAPGGPVEMHEIRRRAGATADTAVHMHDCALYVARGTIELDVMAPDGPQVHRLRPGDSVVVAAGLHYGWIALGGDCAVIEVRIAGTTR